MNNVIDLYARAAAVLYGIISFDDFFRILDHYYGEGSLSKEQIMRYFWTSKNGDPIYYVQDELIVHASIAPGEVTRTLSDIHHPLGAIAPQRHIILPEKEFLEYANPLYHEDSSEVREMESFLKDDLGVSEDEIQETVAEMIFVCRTGVSPTYIMDALNRRGYHMEKEHELDLILLALDLEAGTRQ